MTRPQSKGSPVMDWCAGLTDSQGTRWRFDYVRGDLAIRVRPYAGASVLAVVTHVIPLTQYAQNPEDVTDRWLAGRADAWIFKRNDNLRSGLYEL